MTLSTHLDADFIEEEIAERDGRSRQGVVNKFTKMNHANQSKRSRQRKKEHPRSKVVERLAGIAKKYRIPDQDMDPELAYELVHDELALDGTTTLNLASFVNVHLDEWAQKLIDENLTKNLADNDEYPMMIELQNRCVSMLADLWHAPIDASKPGSGSRTRAIGTPCTGSSEAIMLGGLAMKKNWQQRRQSEGKSTEHPNILMASCCQVALEKFARYFDVEARIVPVSKTDYLINYDEIRPRLDENTIGMFVILGSTYTGGFESVARVSEILDSFQKDTNIDIPIHVDGASGGILAAIAYPELKWDFRLDRVKSINTSGHKFGLTAVGLGWVIFRTEEWLPESLKFQLQYLGGLEESFSLNFSRPGCQVIQQYYNFLRLGRAGYREIFDNCLISARILSLFLEETGYFRCVSNVHLPRGVSSSIQSSASSSAASSFGSLDLEDHEKFNPALPVVSFQFSAEFSRKYPEIPQSTVSKMLRNKKWIVPNYPLPKTSIPLPGEPQNAEIPAQTGKIANNEILRVVVKYDLRNQLLDKLMHDIVDVVEVLVGSVEAMRANVNEYKTHTEDAQHQIGEKMVYDMLLSLAKDADPRLLKQKKEITESHDKHGHISFRGTC